MKRRSFLPAACAITALLCAAPSIARSDSPQPKKSPVVKTASKEKAIDTEKPGAPAWWTASMKTHDQRIGWWREARFGMFIHWGVYSYLGGDWQGQPRHGYAEHIQRIAKIPIPVYREQVAGHFDPVKFDADTWVKLAHDAGMRYLIITAKHHDGFAMYDSHVSDYNVVKATPWHHDPMRDLKAACDKYGVKFGFYYSHAFDWGDANGPGNDWDYDNPGGDRLLHGGRNWWDASPGLLPKVRKYVDGKSIPQIQELIRNYHPAILWFDTPAKLPDSENLRILEAVRAAGPNVVVNGRLVRGMGDYANTADRPAEFPPQSGDWEGIPTTNESYGWSKADRSHKPPAHFIRLLAKAAARGGNLLMNIGPEGDGTIDPADVAILKGIGAWMTVNGDSIHGTERTPLPVQSWGESTCKDGTLYLHVFDWPKDGRLVIGGLKAKIHRAYLLSDPAKMSLTTERVNSDDVRIMVPANAPDATDTVIVVETDTLAGTEIAADSETRLLAPDQVNTLHVFDGLRHGKTLKFGPGKITDAYVSEWTSSEQYMAWPLRLDRPATYDVTVTCDAATESAGGTYTVSLGGQTLSGTVASGKQVSMPLGRITVTPGKEPLELRVAASQIKGTELMKLRSVILTPAAQP